MDAELHSCRSWTHVSSPAIPRRRDGTPSISVAHGAYRGSRAYRNGLSAQRKILIVAAFGGQWRPDGPQVRRSRFFLPYRPKLGAKWNRRLSSHVIKLGCGKMARRDLGGSSQLLGPIEALDLRGHQEREGVSFSHYVTNDLPRCALRGGDGPAPAHLPPKPPRKARRRLSAFLSPSFTK